MLQLPLPVHELRQRIDELSTVLENGLTLAQEVWLNLNNPAILELYDAKYLNDYVLDIFTWYEPCIARARALLTNDVNDFLRSTRVSTQQPPVTMEGVRYGSYHDAARTCIWELVCKLDADDNGRCPEWLFKLTWDQSEPYGPNHGCFLPAKDLTEWYRDATKRIGLIPYETFRNLVEEVRSESALMLHRLDSLAGIDVSSIEQEVFRRETQREAAEKKPKTKATANVTCANFGIPTPTAWREIKLCFVDDHTLRVSVGETHKRLSYSQMGFARNNGTPDVQWELLQGLSRLDDGILHKDDIHPQKREATKKKAQRLSKALKCFFQIQCEPIITLEDNKGWQSILDITAAD